MHDCDAKSAHPPLNRQAFLPTGKLAPMFLKNSFFSF
jgi:hypothetical protein